VVTTSHQIAQLTLELVHASVTDANEAQSRLSDHWQHRLHAELDGALSRAERAGAATEHPRIEVDLGVLTEEDWHEELLRRLGPALLDVLGRAGAPPVPGEPSFALGERETEREHGALERLRLRLLWGADPWWADTRVFKSSDQLVREAVSESRSSFEKWFTSDEAQAPQVRTRFANQTSIETRAWLEGHVGPPPRGHSEVYGSGAAPHLSAGAVHGRERDERPSSPLAKRALRELDRCLDDPRRVGEITQLLSTAVREDPLGLLWWLEQRTPRAVTPLQQSSHGATTRTGRHRHAVREASAEVDAGVALTVGTDTREAELSAVRAASNVTPSSGLVSRSRELPTEAQVQFSRAAVDAAQVPRPQEIASLAPSLERERPGAGHRANAPGTSQQLDPSERLGTPGSDASEALALPDDAGVAPFEHAEKVAEASASVIAPSPRDTTASLEPGITPGTDAPTAYERAITEQPFRSSARTRDHDHTRVSSLSQRPSTEPEGSVADPRRAADVAQILAAAPREVPPELVRWVDGQGKQTRTPASQVFLGQAVTITPGRVRPADGLVANAAAAAVPVSATGAANVTAGVVDVGSAVVATSGTQSREHSNEVEATASSAAFDARTRTSGADTSDTSMPFSQQALDLPVLGLLRKHLSGSDWTALLAAAVHDIASASVGADSTATAIEADASMIASGVEALTTRGGQPWAATPTESSDGSQDASARAVIAISGTQSREHSSEVEATASSAAFDARTQTLGTDTSDTSRQFAQQTPDPPVPGMLRTHLSESDWTPLHAAAVDDIASASVGAESTATALEAHASMTASGVEALATRGGRPWAAMPTESSDGIQNAPARTVAPRSPIAGATLTSVDAAASTAHVEGSPDSDPAQVQISPSQSPSQRPFATHARAERDPPAAAPRVFTRRGQRPPTSSASSASSVALEPLASHTPAAGPSYAARAVAVEWFARWFAPQERRVLHLARAKAEAERPLPEHWLEAFVAALLALGDRGAGLPSRLFLGVRDSRLTAVKRAWARAQQARIRHAKTPSRTLPEWLRALLQRLSPGPSWAYDDARSTDALLNAALHARVAPALLRHALQQATFDTLESLGSDTLLRVASYVSVELPGTVLLHQARLMERAWLHVPSDQRVERKTRNRVLRSSVLSVALMAQSPRDVLAWRQEVLRRVQARLAPHPGWAMWESHVHVEHALWDSASLAAEASADASSAESSKLGSKPTAQGRPGARGEPPARHASDWPTTRATTKDLVPSVRPPDDGTLDLELVRALLMWQLADTPIAVTSLLGLSESAIAPTTWSEIFARLPDSLPRSQTRRWAIRAASGPRLAELVRILDDRTLNVLVGWRWEVVTGWGANTWPALERAVPSGERDRLRLRFWSLALAAPPRASVASLHPSSLGRIETRKAPTGQTKPNDVNFADRTQMELQNSRSIRAVPGVRDEALASHAVVVREAQQAPGAVVTESWSPGREGETPRSSSPRARAARPSVQARGRLPANRARDEVSLNAGREPELTPESDRDLSGLLPIRTRTAGSVLLHPFVASLFTRWGLWDGVQWRSREHQLQAPGVLHWLCTDFEEFAEPDLCLEKVLCGVPLQVPIAESCVPTAEQRELGVGLLSAVTAHWKALRNTSVAGLRGSFLCRPGLIKRADEHWQVLVERRAWDLLLSELPWNLSVFSLPWLKAPTHVKWV